MARQIQIKRPKTSITDRPTPANPGAGLDTRSPAGRRLPY